MTVSLHQVWYKFNIYNMSQYDEVLKATIQTQDAMESDNLAGFVFNADQGSILVGFIYGKWTVPPSIFSAFDTLQLAGTFVPETNGTILTLSQALNIGSSTTAKLVWNSHAGRVVNGLNPDASRLPSPTWWTTVSTRMHSPNT